MTSTDFKTFNIVPVGYEKGEREREKGAVDRGTVKISAEEQIDSRSQKISSVLSLLARSVCWLSKREREREREREGCIVAYGVIDQTCPVLNPVGNII